MFCQQCMKVMLIAVLLTSAIAEGQCLSGGYNNAAKHGSWRLHICSYDVLHAGG